MCTLPRKRLKNTGNYVTCLLACNRFRLKTNSVIVNDEVEHGTATFLSPNVNFYFNLENGNEKLKCNFIKSSLWLFLYTNLQKIPVMMMM